MIYEMKLKNLESEAEVRRMLEQKIEMLLDEAPSDATASTQIMKGSWGYFGTLRLYSSEGQFAAQALSDSLKEMTKSLVTQVHSQIVKWRSHRFESGEKVPALALY